MKGLSIRTDHEGIRASLHDLEADVMECIWEAGWEQFAVADVHDALARRRSIAYTTVMTTVARLHEKGLLRRWKQGKRYIYAPVTSREGFLRRVAREALERLLGPGPRGAEALLVETVAQADEAELDRLAELIQRHKEQLER